MTGLRHKLNYVLNTFVKHTPAVKKKTYKRRYSICQPLNPEYVCVLAISFFNMYGFCLIDGLQPSKHY